MRLADRRNPDNVVSVISPSIKIASGNAFLLRGPKLVQGAGSLSDESYWEMQGGRLRTRFEKGWTKHQISVIYGPKTRLNIEVSDLSYEGEAWFGEGWRVRALPDSLDLQRKIEEPSGVTRFSAKFDAKNLILANR